MQAGIPQHEYVEIFAIADKHGKAVTGMIERPIVADRLAWDTKYNLEFAWAGFSADHERIQIKAQSRRQRQLKIDI